METGKSRVLIVDDNEMNRDILARRLGRMGLLTETAEDGESGLAKIFSGGFDLVLLDIMMPDIDGLEVLKRTRELFSPAELPIIMATARDESGDIVAALKLGANDYVTKPLDFPVVRARVENALSYRSVVSDLRQANQRMSRDLEAAARVQRSLLPDASLVTDEAEFHWFYRPCDELAGDGLNLVRLDDEQVAMYVIDVSGHGVASALLSVSVIHFLSQRLEKEIIPANSRNDGKNVISPARVACRLNELFPMATVGGHYFTLVFGVLNLKTGKFCFVSAGGPGPLVIRQMGKAEVFDAPALPIGMFPEADYVDTVIELGAGDRLYLHSDGIYEERAPESRKIFGRERMQNTLLEAAAQPFALSVEQLVDALANWRGDEQFSDDIAVLGCIMQG